MRPLVLILFTALAASAVEAVPLLGHWPMEPVADGALVADASRQGRDGRTAGTVRWEKAGKVGGALRLEKGGGIDWGGPWTQRSVRQFTWTAWLKLDDATAITDWTQGFLWWKGGNSGVQCALHDQGKVFVHGWAGSWYHFFSQDRPYPSESRWVHVAWTFATGGSSQIWLDGKKVFETPPTEVVTSPVSDPWRLGQKPWSGLVDEVRLYGAALNEAQILADRDGKPVTQPIAEAAMPPVSMGVVVTLGRWDEPRGQAGYDEPTRQPVEKRSAPDAVDFPALSLAVGGRGEQRLFENGGRQVVEVPMREGDEARRMPRQEYDNRLQSGQWFRALAWQWGRFTVHTTDLTTRASEGAVEVWAFPLRIEPVVGRQVQKIRLKLNGREVYARDESLHSLTLYLPQNDLGRWELAVDGAAFQGFDNGLQPARVGETEPRLRPVLLTFPTATARQVEHVDGSGTAAWQRSVQRSTDGKPRPARISVSQPATLAGRVGVAVPRSGVVATLSYQHFGMSGGFLMGTSHIDGFKGTPEEYAAHLQANGFDRDVEELGFNDNNGPDNPRWRELADALASRGLQLMANPKYDILCHPNQGLFTYTLPEFDGTARRQAQLLAGRWKDAANFRGFICGGDNGGYVSFWHWAPPYPDRPWGRAMEVLTGGTMQTVHGPQSGSHTSLDHGGTQAAFLDHIRRYDATGNAYGLFDRAVAAVDPRLVLTSGSFGSAPGVIARGGYPIGSINGDALYRDSRVLQAYDWNEVGSSKPLHLVGLIDRLRSSFPDRPVWAVVDDFGLFFGKQARQRAYALALSRGVQSVGTNFLAQFTGDESINGDGGFASSHVSPQPRKQVVAEQRALFDFIRTFGGTFARMRSTAPIGVLYVHEQAVSRDCGAEDPVGSHEGKTTEALFLCHLAGFPARIVTPAELSRGLPPDMQALFLVGLNRIDGTWAWHQGLEKDLKSFTGRGGRLITDGESECPLPATATGLALCSFINQRWIDGTPDLLARNRPNVPKLQAAMAGITVPCRTDRDTAWAVPSVAGDCTVVTVVNQLCQPRKGLPEPVRIDAGIDFAWVNDQANPGTAMDGISPTNFTVDWNGQIRAPQPGRYTLSIMGNDRAVLSLDGVEIAVSQHAPATKEVELDGNRHTLRIAFSKGQRGGVAEARLRWKRPDGVEEVVPAGCLFPSPEATNPGGLTGRYAGEASYRFENASRIVAGQEAVLTWLDSKRPVYDLALGRRLTPVEQTRCDLRQDGARWYVQPPAAPTAPRLTLKPDADGWYAADVTVGPAGRGVPVQVTVTRGADTATVYGASGFPIRLPLRSDDAAGSVTVTAKELLSGLSGQATVELKAIAAAAQSAVTIDDARLFAAFLARKSVPVAVALTTAQRDDPALMALAERMVSQLKGQGRDASLATAAPEGVVRGAQVWRPGRFIGNAVHPLLATDPVDLVLLGTPRDNPLIDDQALAALLPAAALDPAAGTAVIVPVCSAFTWDRMVLNLCASDVAGLTAAVGQVK